jgi:hypothetical protein
MPAAFGALLGTGTPVTAPNSTYAITTTGSVPAGGHLVVGGTWWEATSATADAAGTGLTADIIATPNADNYHVGLWSFPFPGGLVSGATVTLTFSVAAYAESIMALYLTGIAPSAWLDVSAGASVASFGNWGRGR